eukprot:881830_1
MDVDIHILYQDHIAHHYRITLVRKVQIIKAIVFPSITIMYSRIAEKKTEYPRISGSQKNNGRRKLLRPLSYPPPYKRQKLNVTMQQPNVNTIQSNNPPLQSVSSNDYLIECVIQSSKRHMVQRQSFLQHQSPQFDTPYQNRLANDHELESVDDVTNSEDINGQPPPDHRLPLPQFSTQMRRRDAHNSVFKSLDSTNTTRRYQCAEPQTSLPCEIPERNYHHPYVNTRYNKHIETHHGAYSSSTQSHSK